MSGQQVPEGLHSMQYAAHLLEFELKWPKTRSNMELLNECVIPLSKRADGSTEFSLGYRYLARAIKLAKEQGIPVDRFFFDQGKYTSVRPTNEKKEWAIVSQERDKICEGHGCMSGWVYADKGVVRCQKCVRK